MTQLTLPQLSERLATRLPEILTSFNLEFTEYDNRIVMCCPIHGGDKEDGFSIMKRGVGVWQCFTQQCHTKFKYPTLLTLIQALLRTKSLPEAIKWAKQFLNVETTEYNPTVARQLDFMYLQRHISKKIDKPSMFMLRDTFVKNLVIPSPYFLSRGFSAEVLRRFDVGDCRDPNEFQKFDRAVVPCYDEKGKYIVGYHGRSIYEKCIKCGKHHGDGSCPISAEIKSRCEKWRMSKNFNADSYLYNEWNFNDKYDYVILVEGAGDVWKLEEAGIANSMALFGTKFTEQQQLILEAYPITRLIIATDNDEAGLKAQRSIYDRCKKLFTTKCVTPEKKDLGEMTCLEIRTLFERALT